MNILVTGGAGFIGSHLCERLLREGNEIFCLDNFYTGNRQNIEHLSKEKKFYLLEADIVTLTEVPELDQIFHFACPASPPAYQRDPIYTWKTGVLGTCNLLELALKNKARFMFAGTSEVYGNPLVHPQPESYFGNVNPVGVRSCYDESKRAAESLVADYHRARGLDVRMIRIFNTYGPAMNPNDGRVVSNFIVQALKGKDITVYGDGSQTRSFCYISDLIDGICLMMKQEGFIGPVNLGNPGEFKVIELAEKVLEAVGSNSKITFADLPSDDPEKRKPDITLASQKLGWSPKIKLDEGIQKTVSYFKNLLL